MTRIEVAGKITVDGSLEVELPVGLPPGDAIVTIQLTPAPLEPDGRRSPLRTEPLTGSQRVEAGLIGGWAERSIPVGKPWVDSQRRWAI